METTPALEKTASKDRSLKKNQKKPVPNLNFENSTPTKETGTMAVPMLNAHTSIDIDVIRHLEKKYQSPIKAENSARLARQGFLSIERVSQRQESGRSFGSTD